MLQLKSIQSWIFGSDDEDEEGTTAGELEKSQSSVTETTKPANFEKHTSITSVTSLGALFNFQVYLFFQFFVVTGHHFVEPLVVSVSDFS